MHAQPIPVICDCDPGHDDAISLMLACRSPELDVLAVTTSAGNQTQAKTLDNALRILTLLGRHDIPVARGAEKPLQGELIIADNVHGESGLDGPELPTAAFKPVQLTAVELMATKIRQASQPVILNPTGPLTNIAQLLQQHPDLTSRIKQIVMMGGAADAGNWTPAAEFNIYVDPEAAAIVFDSGIPIVMCGLDVTHKAYLTGSDIADIRALNTPVATCAADLLDFFARYHEDPKWQLKGAPLHDPCTVAWILRPELFTTQTCRVDVETQSALTRGMTVVDRYHLSSKPANAAVVWDVDRLGFKQLLLDRLGK